MTVEELIAKLREFDPRLPVYVRGYEGGVDDVRAVVHVLVHRDENVDSAVFGDHEIYEPEPQFESPSQIELDTRRAEHGVYVAGPAGYEP